MLAGVILAAAVFITGLTMAKYVHQWKSDPALAGAKAFYFTSDLLKEADENARYELYSWGDGITIKLQNFEDAKRFSEADITYEVSYTLTGGEKKEVDSPRKLSKGSASTEKIVIKPDAGAKEITVTAKATAPYQKELTAVFTLKDTAKPRFQVVDSAGSPTAELIIKGGNETQTFQLTWNVAELSPDRTNPLYGSDADGTVDITITARGSSSILLFKDDPSQNYSIREQDITENNISLKNN